MVVPSGGPVTCLPMVDRGPFIFVAHRRASNSSRRAHHERGVAEPLELIGSRAQTYGFRHPPRRCERADRHFDEKTIGPAARHLADNAAPCEMSPKYVEMEQAISVVPSIISLFGGIVRTATVPSLPG